MHVLWFLLLLLLTTCISKQYFCRDSGYGRVTLSLWELVYDEKQNDYVRSDKQPIINNATSSLCTVEVGGCEDGELWPETWKVKSKMSSVLKKLIRLPYLMRRS